MKTNKIAIFPIIAIIAIYWIFFAKSDVSDKSLNNYVKKCIDIPIENLQIIKIEYEIYNNSEIFFRGHSKYRDMILIKGSNINKYFMYEQYIGGSEIELYKNKKIFIRINKSDLANPKLGTKDSPIVTLLYSSSNNTDMFYDIPSFVYKKGLQEYLKYH